MCDLIMRFLLFVCQNGGRPSEGGVTQQRGQTVSMHALQYSGIAWKKHRADSTKFRLYLSVADLIADCSNKINVEQSVTRCYFHQA